MIRTVITALLTGLLLSGCSWSDDDSDRYDDLVNGGWEAYSDGNHELALSRFMSAVQENGDLPEAWNGLAWTEIELFEDEQGDDNYLVGIEGNFLAALERSDNWVPPLAGLALTRSRLEESLSAIHFAGEVLALSGDAWEYNHNTEVTGRSLRKVRAWNYYLLEDFAAAQVEVEIVLDVTLDPEAPDYLSQLLAAIEQL